jgi:coproporphyrinogen III oxidase-like Fe-S oxidoreductase
LNEGVGIKRFIERTGVDPRIAMEQSLSRYLERGLMYVSADSVALTRTGRLIADCIIADCFAELHRCPEFQAGVV